MRTQANGEAIRQLREERGLTITDLSRLSKVSVTHLSRMENGDRDGSWEIRQRVAQALDTSITAISMAKPPLRRDKAAA